MSWRQQFTQNLKQVGFYLDMESEAAKGVISFVNYRLMNLKSLNPHFQFIVREFPKDFPTLHEPYIICETKTDIFHKKVMVADKSVEEIELILKQFVDEARIRKAEDQKDFRTYPMYIHRFNYLKSDYSGSYFEYAEYQRDPELQELHARQHQELLNALPPMKE